jgi:hypothetical protein
MAPAHDRIPQRRARAATGACRFEFCQVPVIGTFMQRWSASKREQRTRIIPQLQLIVEAALA